MTISNHNILLRDSTSTVQEKVHGTVTQLKGYIVEDTEPIYAPLVQAIRNRLRLLYESSLIILEGIENHAAVISVKQNVHDKWEEVLRIVGSHRLHYQFQQLVRQGRAFLCKDLSRQAVVLGFAGLLTGGVIGIFVGYSFRTSSTSSPLSSTSNGNQYVMRAILSTSTRSGIDGVTLTIVPSPTIVNPEEVVVQVKAVGIDSIDTRICCGYGRMLRRHLGLPSVPGPWVLGRECSGIVVDVGHQVSGVEISDRVWVLLPLWAPNGVMSEFVVVHQSCVAPTPTNISYEGAATMPYAFSTFWKEVVQKWSIGGHVAKNKRVLIHLGSSTKNDGVGLLATQIFKSWGSRVTISTEETVENGGEEDFSSEVAQRTFLHSLKTLGAESHLIIPRDYSHLPNLTQRIFDIVINTDASFISPLLRNFCRDPEAQVIETFPTELNHLRRGIGSCLLSILLFPFTLIFGRSPPREKQSTREILSECKKLVESRVLVPVVAKSFTASQYDQALRHVARSSDSPLLAKANVGKCVLVFKSK